MRAALQPDSRNGAAAGDSRPLDREELKQWYTARDTFLGGAALSDRVPPV